jgi:hypothetical protein
VRHYLEGESNSETCDSGNGPDAHSQLSSIRLLILGFLLGLLLLSKGLFGSLDICVILLVPGLIVGLLLGVAVFVEIVDASKELLSSSTPLSQSTSVVKAGEEFLLGNLLIRHWGLGCFCLVGFGGSSGSLGTLAGGGRSGSREGIVKDFLVEGGLVEVANAVPVVEFSAVAGDVGHDRGFETGTSAIGKIGDEFAEGIELPGAVLGGGVFGVRGGDNGRHFCALGGRRDGDLVFFFLLIIGCFRRKGGGGGGDGLEAGGGAGGFGAGGLGCCSELVFFFLFLGGCGGGEGEDWKAEKEELLEQHFDFVW